MADVLGVSVTSSSMPGTSGQKVRTLNQTVCAGMIIWKRFGSVMANSSLNLSSRPKESASDLHYMLVVFKPV